MLVEALRIALPLLAILVAGLALAIAIRLQRHHRRLSRALAREWGLRTGRASRGASDAAAPASSAERDVAALERELEETELRLRALTQRLSNLESRPRGAAPSAPGAGKPAPAERVRAHLEALGFEQVTLVARESSPGTLHYEAREHGMPRKGTAHLEPDGRVVLEPGAAHRAFP